MITVLLNTAAGPGHAEDLSERLSAIFQKLGAEARIERAESGTHLCDLAREAASGPRCVIAAGGGDGTVSAVASVVAGTDHVLGVLPLGTLNHFAKDAGLPLELEAAARVLVAGSPVSIDLGEVNGRVFINNSSIGLYPDAVRRREKEQEAFNRGKWSAFTKAVIGVLGRSRILRIGVSVDGGKFNRATPFVFIGNNAYDLDGFGIGGRLALDRGELCVWMAHGTRRFGLVRLAVRALFGRLRGARDFEAFCVDHFEIAPRQGMIRVALDGETVMIETPLRYRSLPGALKLMVPRR